MKGLDSDTSGQSALGFGPQAEPTGTDCGAVCFGYSDLTLPSLPTAPAGLRTIVTRHCRKTHARIGAGLDCTVSPESQAALHWHNLRMIKGKTRMISPCLIRKANRLSRAGPCPARDVQTHHADGHVDGHVDVRLSAPVSSSVLVLHSAPRAHSGPAAGGSFGGGPQLGPAAPASRQRPTDPVGCCGRR